MEGCPPPPVIQSSKNQERSRPVVRSKAARRSIAHYLKTHAFGNAEFPNYLIALNVGEFVEVPLEPAHVGSRRIPLSVWTSPGTEEDVAFTFWDTPRMVEYFSDLFGYPYPWPKYDQITLREFDGAMETTTMVGFTETYQRRSGDRSGHVEREGHAVDRRAGRDRCCHIEGDHAPSNDSAG